MHNLKSSHSRTTTRSTTTPTVLTTERTTTTKTVASIDFMEQSPSKISESSFDDFKKVKSNHKASDISTDYEYDYEEDEYMYPDRHAPQSVVPVKPTPAPSMKNTPIRMWKV